jgi:hypothetical protein
MGESTNYGVLFFAEDLPGRKRNLFNKFAFWISAGVKYSKYYYYRFDNFIYNYKWKSF